MSLPPVWLLGFHADLSRVLHTHCRMRGCPNDYQTNEPFQQPLFPKEHRMRVMVIVKATKSSEAGVMPAEELLVT